MKIDLTQVDTESFYVNSHIVAGETVYHIHPKHIGARWTRENLIYRSSVWNERGELVSAGFKKFFNWSEQPDLAYTPFSLSANGGCQLIEKIDGSTLIVSLYKGERIVRTRGCMTPEKMEKSGHEIELLKKKYPTVFEYSCYDFDSLTESSPNSFIFEWVSPANKIVINYGDEPDLYLIGAVKHKDYSYESQEECNDWAKFFGVKRPLTFKFDSIKEMLGAVEALQGQEGICVYCNRGQDIRKVKSAWYLALHKMKSELASIDKVIDLWLTLDQPDFHTFYEHIASNFDYELAQQNLGYISKICEASKEVDKIIAAMHEFVSERVKPLPTRAEQAKVIIGAYGKTNRSGFCFSILDGRPIKEDNEIIKKLLYQVLKNN
jgi:hypothetical protein